jgi:hypothetical protein
MRFKTVLFLTLFSISLSCCKKTKEKDSVSTINLERGLIAYYPFNGNTSDESGNSNHGVAEMAALTYDQHGNEKRALNCTGNGSKMIVSNNGKIKFDTSFSVSFHVMIRNFSRHHFVSMISNDLSTDLSFGIGTNVPGSNKLNFGIPNLNVPCNNTVVPLSQSSFIHEYVLQPESWYNIVATFASGTMKVFVNGNLISQTHGNTPSMRICPGANLIVGGWWKNDPTGSLDGKIDEVRLYDRQLNADEVKLLAKHFNLE